MAATERPLDPAWLAENKGPTVIIFLCVFTPVAWLFCCMRMYTRGIIMGKLRLDDGFCTMSVICALLSMCLSIKAVLAGSGKHLVAIPEDQRSNALFWSMIALTPSVESFALPKLGVVALLVRLLSPGPIQKAFLWTLAIVCFISLSLCNVILFTTCDPVPALWDITITEGMCRDPSILVDYSLYAGTLSACTDLYLAIYPAIVLFRLQMRLKKKIALITALGIGSIASIVSIYRITRIPELASPDFTYETSDLVIWNCIEAVTLIVAACIPVLQPLYEKVFGKTIIGSSNKGRKYRGYNGSGDNSKRQHDLEDPDMINRRRGPRDPNGLTFLDQTNIDGEENTLTKIDSETSSSTAPETTITTDISGFEGSDGQCVTQVVHTDGVSQEYGHRLGSTEKKAEKRWTFGF